MRVGVLAAPMIPGLNDHELPQIIAAAVQAGAQFANFTPLRLPYAVKDIFSDWLERHFPERKDKVLNRVRAMRGGKLNDPNFGSRMRGEGIFAEQLSRMYEVACRKAGLPADHTELSVAHFRRAEGAQLSLF